LNWGENWYRNWDHLQKDWKSYNIDKNTKVVEEVTVEAMKVDKATELF
jgi:hypothetical protein